METPFDLYYECGKRAAAAKNALNEIKFKTELDWMRASLAKEPPTRMIACHDTYLNAYRSSRMNPHVRFFKAA